MNDRDRRNNHDRPPALEEWVTLPNGARARRCRWWSRKTRRQCGKAAMKAARVCRTHGGTNAARMLASGNPNFKTGRWSALLHCAPSAPTPLHLFDEIDLVDVRLTQLVGQIAASTCTFVEVRAAFDGVVSAMKAEDSSALRVNLTRLSDLVHSGAASDVLWSQVHRLVELRKDLVADERRFRLLAANTLSRHAAAALGEATANAIVRCVHDPDDLRALLAELRRIFGAIEPTDADGGGTIQ